MPGVALANAKDVRHGMLMCSLHKGEWVAGEYGVTPARFCSRVVLCSGEAPSYSFLSVPMRGFGPGKWDELAPSVALLNASPALDLKLVSRASIAYAEGQNASTLMTGWLVSNSHQIDEDSIVSQIYDDRWLMSKFTVFGQMVYDPTIYPSGKYYFDVNLPCIFNALGFPNCVDTPMGPRFAPCHRFGYKTSAEDTTEPEPGQAIHRARSWRVSDAIKYLRDMFFVQQGNKRPPLPVNCGVLDLPPEINWPEKFGELFGSIRTLKAFNCNNWNLLSSLQGLLRKAGAYDLYTRPLGSWNSELVALDMNPKTFTGTTLMTAQYAASHVGVAMNSGTIIKEGYIVESFINGFHNVCILGDGPAVEKMCSTAPNGSIPGGPVSPGIGALALEPAWSPADEQLFKNYIAGFDNDKKELAYRTACLKWPEVYAAYRVKLNHNPWLGTKWSANRNGGYMRVKTHQLTGYQQDSANPRNWTPREIVVEYYKDNEYENPDDDDPPESKWLAAERYDNLTLSADSTIIRLTGLRDNYQSWGSRFFDPSDHGGVDPNSDGGQFSPTYMHPRHVRLNLAIEADWPLTGFDDSDPNKIYGRVCKNPKFTYLSVAEPMDYVEYLRKGDPNGSRPIGAADVAAGALIDFPARDSEGHELFTDRVNATTGRLPNHATVRNKDVKRVEYNGQLFFAPMSVGMQPGLNCSVVGGNTLPFFGVLKTVIFDANGMGQPDEHGKSTSHTCVELGPPETATIYDMPGPTYSSSMNGTSSYPEVTRKEDPYEWRDEKPTENTITTITKNYDGTEDKKTTTVAGPTTVTQGSSKTTGKPKIEIKPSGDRQVDRFERGAVRSEQRLSKMQQAKEQLGNESQYDDDPKTQRAVRQLDKEIRRQGKKAENKRNRANDARANMGFQGNIGHWLGKPSRGSMTFANGETMHAGQMGDWTRSYLGRLSNGQFARSVNISRGAGMFDTRKADQYDRTNTFWRDYFQNQSDRRSMNNFSNSGWGGKPGRWQNGEDRAGVGLAGPVGAVAPQAPPAAPVVKREQSRKRSIGLEERRRGFAEGGEVEKVNPNTSQGPSSREERLQGE